MDGIPHPFEFQLLPDDWDQFAILMEKALERVPALETAEIKTFLNGPESFTPDNNFLLGAAPECAGVYVAAGFNSMGIASAGGAGKALAEWIVAGAPTRDLWPVDIRRFAPFNANPAWLKDRVVEVLGLHYAMPWPNRELASARPFRRSPLYDRLAAKDAVFGSKMGWERPNYFARNADEKTIRYSFGPQNWAATAAAEHRACREAAALFDMTSFAKLRLEGPDALALVQRLCANDMDVPVGRSVYTAMLNPRGGFESDLTAIRLAADVFLLVTGSAQPVRDADWIARNMNGARATLTDVTASMAVLALMGPRARDILARVTSARLDDASFPLYAARDIPIGHATALASRRSYMGELGWEIFAPVEFAATIYDTLMQAGGDFGLVDAGYYAVDSLRLEKGFRAWGRELTPDCNPWEAGLGFAVKLDKGDFIGRAALIAAKDKPLTRRLVALLGPPPADQMAWGGEAIHAGDRAIGEITSAAFGPTLGGIVALGWVSRADGPVTPDWLAAQTLTIDLAGSKLPVSTSLSPLYDPSGVRLRG